MHAPVWQYLLEVARHGSVRKAGAALNVSSSGINQRILQLERDLGVQLFDRSPRGMEPTTAGRLLINHARNTLADFDRVLPLIKDVQSLKAGHVEIACPEFFCSQALPQIFEAFVRQHPSATATVVQIEPEAIAQVLDDGIAEIGVTYRHLARPSMREIANVQTPIGIIATPDNDLVSRGGGLRLLDCSGYELVSYSSLGEEPNELSRLIAQGSVAAKFVCKTNSLAFAKSLVTSGRAIAIDAMLPYLDEIRDGRLRFISLEDPQLPVLSLSLCIPANRTIDAIERSFTKMVAKFLTDVFATSP